MKACALLAAPRSCFPESEPAAMTSSRTVRKLCDVRDLMRDCYRETLTLQSLSLEAELSPLHFLRAFRDRSGEPAHQFLTHVGIDRAKDLLTITRRPITEICFDVGFTSLVSFSTLFGVE